MTIPKTYVRATDGAANGSAYETRFARRMKKLSCAAALALACLCLVLLAGCGGGATITVEISPNTAQTVDESQSPCNAPNNLLGCQMINFAASVGGDTSNSGVTWNLSVDSTGCSGTGCGTLINVTTNSVTYVAPTNIAAELTGVVLEAVSNSNGKATSTIDISIVLDPTFSTTGLQQCAVGVFCLPSGSNGIAYNSNQGLVVTNGVAPYTFISPTVSTTPIQINAGGPAVPPFVADEDFTGGTTTSSGNTINISNVADPAPAAVYQTARTSTASGIGGAFSYTIGGFTPGSVHLLRLHFCDTVSTAAGQRTFNVSVNGTQVLTSFDIFAAAGKNIAIIEQGSLAANSSGQFIIQFTGVVGEALVNGIEVESNSCLPSTLNIGTLPPGLTLNPGTGTIVGRPSSPTAGNPAIPFQFTVQAADNSATPVSACANFQITVQPPPTLSITTTLLPPGTVNAAYNALISTNGGVTPLTFTITPNGLPPGLNFNAASGQITGIPKSKGVFNFTVQVQDSSLPSQTAPTLPLPLSITINAPAPLQIISSPNLPGGATATPYGPLPLIAIGGVGPYTWTVVTGQPPAGLTLAPDGTISGTPVLATNPPTDDFFTVQVADSEVSPTTGLPAPQTVTQVFNVTISTGTISPNTLLNGRYTFIFHGFDTSLQNGVPVTGPVTMVGNVSMGGNGTLTGEEDTYRDFPSTTSAPAGLAGVYSIGTDGRGTMELVATNPVSQAVSTIDYRLVLDSGSGPGAPNVRFFQDNSTHTNNDAPRGTHGEGIMKPVIGSDFTAASFSGNYAFGFSGYEAAGKLPVALAGVVHADPTMTTPSLTGTCDFNDAGIYNGSLPLSGIFATTVDSFGRSTAQLIFAQPGQSQVTLNFVFYFVSPTDIYFMEVDTSADKFVFYLLNGEMLLQQPGYQFANASLAGPSVATGTGLDANGNASVFAGLFTAPACDGSTLLSLDYDQNDGGLITQPSFSGITCTVASNGRAALTQFASDTFERANGPVGANWTATEGVFSIANDSVFLSAQGGDMLGSMFWNGASFFPDQFSQLTITSAGGTGTSLGPAVRMQSSGENYYVLNYVVTVPASSSKISLQVVSSGVATTLGTFAHQVVPGDVLRLEIRGKSLTALLNGATIITATDSTFASGSPGIWGLNTTLAATGDDWSGGGLTTRVAATYLTGPGQGFLIGSDTAVTTGLLELQSGGPSFLVSSVQGGYTLDTGVPQEDLVTNVIGQVYSAGGGNMTGTVDEYDPPSVADPKGVPHFGQSLVSPYTVSTNGRGTLGPNTITGFPQNLIIYVVSPGSFRAISADANPGNGHPVVYFFNH
jgi:Malectin domain/Putative Ig domain